MRTTVGVVASALLAVTIGFVAPPAHAAPAVQVTSELACPSCEDYNACTADSCDPATGTCRHDPLACDDGNSCTTDTCTPIGSPGTTGCHHVFLTSGSACNDGDACTAADACNASGQCAGQLQPGGSTCDDGNPCTAGDACGTGGTCAGTPLAAGAECDDRNACTLGERCTAGPEGSIACQAPERSCDDGLRCTADSCDAITGDCVHTAINCDDGNPCTVDACDEATGACSRSARAGSCDDKNICTLDDTCLDGNCLGGGNGTCGWGDQCGSSVCLPFEQRCLTSPDPGDCPAPPVPECGNRYDCFNGFCRFVQGSGPGPCDDGNSCTIDMCVRGGCVPQLPLTGPACNDGTACTTGDVCQAGVCRGNVVCGDGDACTDDVCDAASGACLGHPLTNCDDGNPCTIDSCNPASGCHHTATSDACDDHNACTSNDRCETGQCRGTSAVSCPDDGNPCTFDDCDPATGACLYPDRVGLCFDADPCTVGDFCQGGACHSGPPNSCTDFNACTADVCEPTSGACLHAPAAGPCSDGNACTTGDTCVAGACQGGPPPICDDGNPCTTDSCFTNFGCFPTPITAGPCEDGNPCTSGDACVNGVCRPNAPVSCIDGNACTVDHCDRTTGACVHEATGADCDDGDACTIDHCDPADGTCLGHAPVDCDDGNSCTSDACDPATGCTHVTTCQQQVVDIRISFSSPAGQGSGTLSWRTTAEATLAGFNILVIDQQDRAVRINAAPLPCTQCVTAAGASYTYTVPKHKSGQGVFVEMIGSDGIILGRFGPAEKVPKSPGPAAAPAGRSLTE